MGIHTCVSVGRREGGTRKHTEPTAVMLHCQKAGACCVGGLLDSPNVGVKVRVRIRVNGIRVSRVLKVRTIEGEGILRNADNCQGVICRKSSAERSAKYPLSLFRIPQPKNSASFTVKLSFDDLIWFDIAAYFNV